LVPHMSAAGVPLHRMSAAGSLAATALVPHMSAAGVPLHRMSAAGSLAATAHPRGVDLNLNQFCLETPQQVVEGNWVCGPQSPDACRGMVDAFWGCVSAEKSSTCEDESVNLLRSVFNPHLCDRQAEDDCFTPPDTSLNYANRLRSLVKEEEEIRQQRINHFLSTSFLEDKPGPLFSISWTESMEVSRQKVSKKQGGMLQPWTNHSLEAEEALKSGTPVFEKVTEDGTIFRIYRMGTVELRTTQVHDGKETVGVIFSVRHCSDGSLVSTQTGYEEITKVTEYVEKMSSASQGASKPDFKYYIVLEAERGSSIVTEQIGDKVLWEENREDLEDRNSLAKVIRTAPCRGGGIRVQDLLRAKRPLLRLSGGDRRKSQAYAMNVFTYAVGGLAALMKSWKNNEKVCNGSKDIDVDDEDLEQKLVDEVAGVGSDVKLSPCSQCSEPFSTGYKGMGGVWLCGACWQVQRDKEQVQRDKESQHRWEDGW